MIIKKYVLGPLLLIQGLWVRRKTPVLPEPVKQTNGSIGSGKSIGLLLLGDSSAAGVGAESSEDSLLGQLLKNLSPKCQVNYRLLAQTGETTAGMINKLNAHSEQKFDVVITALGVNDVTTQVPPEKWLGQQQTLLELIRKKFSPRLILLSGLPPVRDFPALPWPLNSYMGDCADALNQVAVGLSEEYDEVVFHSLRDYPPEAEAAIDGFHPGPGVYALWAHYLAEDISASLLQ